jgi:galactonate dehydratase
MKLAKIEDLHCDAGWRTFSFLKLTTDDGLVGWSEYTEADGSRGLTGVIYGLADPLIGQDPRPVQQIASTLWVRQVQAPGGINSRAIAAIENALLDIKGKALGVPVYELLGGKFRDEVRVYANGWSYQCVTPDDYASAAQRPISDGYTALKCYPLAIPNGSGGIRHVSRRCVDRDFADLAFRKVKALRQAFGPQLDIMVDLSGGLTTDETIRLCHRLEELNLLFVEEPVDPFEIGALKKVSEHVDIPIALGERIYTRYGFRPILECHAADILQPDIGNTGGIMEAKKIAAMAETYNMRIQPHICASPVSTAAALQLDACIANFMIQELYPYRSPEHFGIVDHAPEHDVRHSNMPIPDRPGLGVNLVKERVRPFLWAECTLGR